MGHIDHLGEYIAIAVGVAVAVIMSLSAAAWDRKGPNA